jgi:hypothetical protein
MQPLALSTVLTCCLLADIVVGPVIPVSETVDHCPARPLIEFPPADQPILRQPHRDPARIVAIRQDPVRGVEVDLSFAPGGPAHTAKAASAGASAQTAAMTETGKKILGLIHRIRLRVILRHQPLRHAAVRPWHLERCLDSFEQHGRVLSAGTTRCLR